LNCGYLTALKNNRYKSNAMSEQEYDFDSLSQLAQSDPQAFEAKRLEMIGQLIADAPEEMRQRLRSFQWRIDRERERSDNPLQACIRLSNMMWDMVYADRGFLWSLQALADPTGAVLLGADTASAEVIQLKPPR